MTQNKIVLGLLLSGIVSTGYTSEIQIYNSDHAPTEYVKGITAQDVKSIPGKKATQFDLQVEDNQSDVSTEASDIGDSEEVKNANLFKTSEKIAVASNRTPQQQIMDQFTGVFLKNIKNTKNINNELMMDVFKLVDAKSKEAQGSAKVLALFFPELNGEKKVLKFGLDAQEITRLNAILHSYLFKKVEKELSAKNIAILVPEVGVIRKNNKTLLVTVADRAAGKSVLEHLRDEKLLSHEKKIMMAKVGAAFSEMANLGISHGDAHFGNVFYDTKSQKVSFIDVETLNFAYMGNASRGTADYAADIEKALFSSYAHTFKADIYYTGATPKKAETPTGFFGKLKNLVSAPVVAVQNVACKVFGTAETYTGTYFNDHYNPEVIAPFLIGYSSVSENTAEKVIQTVQTSSEQKGLLGRISMGWGILGSSRVDSGIGAFARGFFDSKAKKSATKINKLDDYIQSITPQAIEELKFEMI